MQLDAETGRYLQERVDRGEASSIEAYVKQLIVDDQGYEQRLEAKLIEALESGPATEMTPSEWSKIKDDFLQRHECKR